MVDTSVSSLTTVNCNGTVTEAMRHNTVANKGLFIIAGRVRISNFERTGADPGVVYTIPDGYVADGYGSVVTGYCGIGGTPRTGDCVRVSATDSSAQINIRLTENLTNVSGTGTAWIVLPPIAIKIKLGT